MKKIRIPRKLKKHANKILDKNWKLFPNVPKLMRYHHWFVIEEGIKKYQMSAEELVENFGRYMYDDVIWWHWVRWKELGIEPKMSKDFQEYWDYFVEKGVISHDKERTA